ncbi:UBC-like protein [Canariomyces notabilis]|uniref:UBC-like protein n=1 Tax=Canariomyces notabilis TaxID=2074819 RepID=A0AAN6TE18_9PEZI|nr:UBC-like protein [Canariomyces arenarius]
MGFWKVVMEGPEGSPYEAGVFLLYLDIGLDFPRVPPAVRFITPILHPNISKHGRICHPIFDREWTGSRRIYEILMHIYGLLMTLESRDTIDPIAALKFYTDPEESQLQVRRYIDRFATKTRAEHREAITANHDDTTRSALSTITSVSSSTVTFRTP